MVRTLFTDAGVALNMAKSHFDPAYEQELIGYLANCSLHWDLGRIGYLSPTVKRRDSLTSLALKLVKRWYMATPREMARVSSFIVSMRPMYDPAALCFTKYIYIWIQSLINSGYSYDWYQPLSAEARAELQVWIDYAVAWSRKPCVGLPVRSGLQLRVPLILPLVGGLACTVVVHQSEWVREQGNESTSLVSTQFGLLHRLR